MPTAAQPYEPLSPAGLALHLQERRPHWWAPVCRHCANSPTETCWEDCSQAGRYLGFRLDPQALRDRFGCQELLMEAETALAGDPPPNPYQVVAISRIVAAAGARLALLSEPTV